MMMMMMNIVHRMFVFINVNERSKCLNKQLLQYVHRPMNSLAAVMVRRTVLFYPLVYLL